MTTHPIPDKQRQGTRGEKQQRRKRVTNKQRPALVRSIAQAIVIKDEEAFFLCDRDGCIPLGGKHGYGLYYHDCRFLNGYELKLAGTQPGVLVATAQQGFEARFELTNSDLRMSDGGLIAKEDLGIAWERLLDTDKQALYDRLTLTNYSLDPVAFPLTVRFSAGFEDVFAVRGMLTKALGTLHPPRWQDGRLFFLYDGSDGVRRSLTVHFSPAPAKTEKATAHFEIALGGRQRHTLEIGLVLAEAKDEAEARPEAQPVPEFDKVSCGLQSSCDQWLHNQTAVRTDSPPFNDVLGRSLRDLRVLRIRLNGHGFFAAGVPRYVTLFGRDSLISALQTLAYEPQIAGHTLRLVAGFQGTKADPWRDEEPGKVLHELRVGELAHDDEIPQTPYYGSIDATPLFLILLARHALWTGTLDLFHELRPNVERALGWMDGDGQPTGDAYLAYELKSKRGLGNQGWKDSGDAIMNADGSLATPPIALAEVQGYAYLAKRGVADLYRRAGDADRAGLLEQEAEDLRRRFNRDFWLPDLGVYALALQKGGEPCAVVASNAGQVLWSGIADGDKARATAERLLAEDMFSGWGIRTLSQQERRYNPIGYHLGTVWPHDNALILAGLRTYGHDDAARIVSEGMVHAATHFPSYRLPEVFAGFRRDAYGIPVHYPVACHPQAWAAGAVAYMVESLLGLVPDGFARRLRIVRPVLPSFVGRLEVHGLRVGGGRVDLRFQRGSEGKVLADVLRTKGNVDVTIEPGASA
jgi:glycogen debranching enzyme